MSAERLLRIAETSSPHCRVPWRGAGSSQAAEIGPWRGAAKRAVVQHFVDLRSKKNDAERKALTGEIYQDFNAQLNEAYRSVPPIAGAEEAIRKLRENGYLVAATTGFDREIVVPIFRRLGWEKYFVAVVASNDVSRGRPSPYMLFHAMETAGVDSVAAVMAVGDTPLDLQAANNAGLRGMVGVSLRCRYRRATTPRAAHASSRQRGGPARATRTEALIYYAAGLAAFSALRAAISACNARFLARRLIFCLRRRWNRAVSPQVFDINLSFRKRGMRRDL